MLHAKLTGDWEKSRTILNNSVGVVNGINIAVLREAEAARRDIVKGITKQEPGGQKFLKLAALTLALRKYKGFRGSKALLITAGLRNSVTVKRAGPGRAFVGVLKGAQNAAGKELFNIARVHEVGATIVIRVTPKMRKYFMTFLRRSGFGLKAQGRDRRGRYSFNRNVSGGRGGFKAGVIIVKVPARPFITPVIEQILKNPIALQRRLAYRIAQHLKLTLGRP